MTIRFPYPAEVVRFHGREGISELFEFTCDLIVPRGVDVPFEAVLGKEGTVAFRPYPGIERHFSGMVSRFGETDCDDDFTHFRVTLVPRFWRLTRRRRSRIFQEQSVIDILQVVLKELDVVYESTPDHHPRNYCVQYQETDFAFACRLMEEEGIRYFFRHHADKHQLVLSDNPCHHVDIPGMAVAFDAQQGGVRAEPRIRAWDVGRAITGESVTLWAHHYQMPGKRLEGKETVSDEVAVGQGRARLRGTFNKGFSHFAGDSNHARLFDGIGPDDRERPEHLTRIQGAAQDRAERHMQEESTRAFAMTGVSDAPQLLPGHAFALTRHGVDDGKYYVTRVEHEASQSAPRSGDEIVWSYENRFRALPVSVGYRPSRQTPRPRIVGTQTAFIAGPGNAAAHVGKLGRVKIRFPWDREPSSNGNSSCWVRVAQAWAGKHWGAFFWPRLGHEVVVAFEDGDPDRPVIIGSVYNSTNKLPLDLPASDLVSGIKSASAGSDPITDYNGLFFHDRVGEEHLQVHSQRADLVATESSRFDRIGECRVATVGGFGNTPGSGDGGDKGWRSHLTASAAQVFGGWAKDLDFTVGDSVRTTLGLSGTNVVGAWTDVFVNPVGFIGQSGVPGLIGLGSLMAKNDMTLATDSWLIYGPQVFIHRGMKLVHQSRKLSPGVLAAATLIGGVAIAGNIVAGFGAAEGPSRVWDGATKALQSLLFGALIGQEASKAKAAGAAALDQIKKLSIQTADAAAENAKETLALGMGKNTDDLDAIDLKINDFTLSAGGAINIDATAGNGRLSPQIHLTSARDAIEFKAHKRLLIAHNGTCVDLDDSGCIQLKCDQAGYVLIGDPPVPPVESADDDMELRQAPRVHLVIGNWPNCEFGVNACVKSATTHLGGELLTYSNLGVSEHKISLDHVADSRSAGSLTMSNNDITLRFGDSEIEVNKDGITIKAKRIDLASDVEVKLKAVKIRENYGVQSSNQQDLEDM